MSKSGPAIRPEASPQPFFQEMPMKYLCLVYFDPALLTTMSAAERAKLDNDSMDYDEALAARGQLIVAEALQPPASARVAQTRGGKLSQTDGPFVETKEQLGGFILVDVPDLNAAIQVAARIPLAKYGAIEVRPIAKVERIAS
jgi:hypothetical protein